MYTLDQAMCHFKTLNLILHSALGERARNHPGPSFSTQASRKLDDIDKLVWIETSHLDQRPQGDILLMDITFLVTLRRELSRVNSLTLFIVDITFVVTLSREVSGNNGCKESPPTTEKSELPGVRTEVHATAEGRQDLLT